MNRSLVIGISITIAIIIGIAVVFYVNFIKVKSVPAIQAVPSSATMLMEVKNIRSAWNNFSSSSMWKDLSKNESIKMLDHKIRFIDSLIGLNENLKTSMADNKTVISFHLGESQKITMLVITETGKNTDVNDIARWITSVNRLSMQKRLFEGVNVFDMIDNDKKAVLTISYLDQLLICSSEASLVEESLRKLKYHSQNSTKGFEQLAAMGESTGEMSVYINYKLFPAFIGQFTRSDYGELFAGLKNFANWSMFEARSSQDNLTMSGLTYTDDSLFQYLDLFKTQNPVDLGLQKILPRNTGMYIQTGISDYQKFATDLMEYLQVHKKSESYMKYIDSLENRYGIDLGDKFSVLLGDEALLGMLEPVSADVQKELFAVVKFKDKTQTELMLKNYLLAISKRGERDSLASTTYNGFNIEHLPLGNFMKVYFGELFENLHSPYYVMIDNRVVFANSPSTIKSFIDQYSSGNTLGKDSAFLRFSEHSAGSANISFYLSPGHCYLLPTTYVTDEMLSVLNRYQYDFKKFESFSIQYANSNNKAFFTNLNVKYTVSVREDTRVLWATKLDTTIAGAPSMVYNSGTKQNCILVQDVNHTLYYLNNTGNIQWRVKISGPILGTITQVDAQKNGKILYLFNTANQASLIDENGNNQPGFPLRFPGNASHSLSLFDFNNDSNYQLFVPLENNRIAAYTIAGRPIQGWIPKITDEKVTGGIISFRTGNKSFVMAHGVKGALMIWNVKGDKLKFDYQGTVHPGISLFAQSADSNLAFIVITDTSGVMNILTTDSTLKFIPNNNIRFTFKPEYIDLKIDAEHKEWTVLAGNRQMFVVYDRPDHISFTRTITDSILSIPFMNSTISNKMMIGFVEKSIGKMNWLNTAGLQYPSFPVDGQTAFTVCNLMMDGGNYLIGGDRNSNLMLVKLK